MYEDGNGASSFNPILDSLRIAAIFIKYALSSAASSIVDLAVFAVFSATFAGLDFGTLTIAAATCAARVVSGVVNFIINRHLVFGRGDERAGVRYAVLWASCMCASALLVTALASAVPAVPALAVKVVVDVALFFVNYRIQEAWVFTDGRE